jgi:Protein of unknown function (DUF3617)
MTSLHRLLMTLPMVFVAAVQAQTMAPGLWEQTTQLSGAQVDGAMAQMQAQLEQLPPDQRKMAEEMMARQGGGPPAGKGSTVRLCLSPTQAARSEIPSEPNCTHQALGRNGATVRYAYRCTGNPPSNGEGEFTLAGDKAYSGKLTANAMVEGKTEQMQMRSSGRWIGPDCGGLKPRP